MALIKLELDTIASAAIDSHSVSRVFDETDASSQTTAEACGHEALSGQIRRFSTTWDDRRAEFTGSLDGIAAALEAIDQAFHELDLRLSSEK